jgi:hypothetical protein
MTNAELDEIFADIDAGLENWKRTIEAMSAQCEDAEATRRIIRLAAEMREAEIGYEPCLQTCH